MSWLGVEEPGCRVPLRWEIGELKVRDERGCVAWKFGVGREGAAAGWELGLDYRLQS